MTATDLSPPPVPPKDPSANIIEDDSSTNRADASGSTSILQPTLEQTVPELVLPRDDRGDMASLTPLELHQLTQNILDEHASERPLIGAIVPLATLREEYENGSGSFVKQIDYLAGLGYKGIRRTRGDGDCFYRSLGFAYIERLLHAHNQTLAVAKALSLLEAILPILEAAGFQQLVFEDFYDVVASLIRQIVLPEDGGTVLTDDILLEAFQSPEVSNCIVVFLRLMTSAVIRTEPELYAPFLFDPETGLELPPREFCERYVEAVGKEADHVQMTAISRALKVNFNVAYLDGHSRDGIVSFVEFANVQPEDSPNPPVLLYRPGHYDILTTQI